MRALVGGLLMAAVPTMTACNGDPPSETPAMFESVQALRTAADAAPGFSCDTAIGERWGDVHAEFRSRFAGMEGFGGCVDGGDTRYLIVFDNAAHLRDFVDSQQWVEFERIFAPVDEGQTFTAAAGENWIITNLEPNHAFLDTMAATRMESRPAQSAPPTG